jgi:GWxTD domain-containing protein
MEAHFERRIISGNSEIPILPTVHTFQIFEGAGLFHFEGIHMNVCARLWIPGQKAMFCLAVLLLTIGAGQSAQKNRREDIDVYKKWLDEDVVYIISAEEKDVFQKLTTDAERDAFIEQFWARRDPDTSTRENEFKEEHYRRVQYANEQFTAGKPGWRTDRGWFYIKFGPPDRRETFPAGRYFRESWEGGGVTSVYPFERWWYRNIEGVGSDVEVEFVDSKLSGDYELAIDADDKDALYNSPAGSTQLELEGILTRSDRVSRRYMGNPVNKDLPEEAQWFDYKRLQDQIWYRVNQLFRLEKPPVLKNPKLREAVDAKITYPSSLPFKFQYSYYHLNSSQYLVPLSINVPNRDLEYTTTTQGIYSAKVEVYIRVTGLNGRVYYEFDREMYSQYPSGDFPNHASQSSAYQESLTLPPGRFKIDLVLQNGSNRMGYSVISIALPSLDDRNDRLEVSPIVIAQELSRFLAVPQQITPFVIGNVKVVPAFDHAFAPNSSIGVYLQVYGFSFDSATSKPEVKVSYEIVSQAGKEMLQYDDDGGRSSAVQGNDRLVVARKLPLLGLPPGKYLLKVLIRDDIADLQKEASGSFEVAG